MPAASDKPTLRRELLARRRALPEPRRAELSRALCAHLADWLGQRAATHVFLYYPVKAEPDLLVLPALAPELTYGLPVVDAGSGMVFHAWRPGDAMAPNRFGIPEPVAVSAPVLRPGPGTVILTPCLALDRRGIRLGYGGGFYDRYLAAAPAATAVGVLFAACQVDEVPAEGHDAVLAWSATELGVRHRGPGAEPPVPPA